MNSKLISLIVFILISWTLCFSQEPAGIIESRKIYEEALDSKNVADLGDKTSRFADAHFNNGNYARALDLYKESNEYYRANNNNEEVARNYRKMSTIFKNRGNFKLAEKYISKALSIIKKTNKNEELSCLYCYIGELKEMESRYSEAVFDFKKAIEISKNDSISNRCRIKLAKLYRITGEYDKSIEVYNKALAVSKELPSSEKANIYEGIGIIYFFKKNYELSKEFHIKSLREREKNKETNRDLARSYINLGNLYNALCEYAEAAKNFRKAAEVSDINLSHIYDNTARAYFNAGMYSLSLKYYKKTIEHLRLEDEVYKEALTLAKLSDIYITIADTLPGKLKAKESFYKEALNYAYKALDIAEKTGVKEYKNAAYNCIYKSYVKLGNKKKAAEYETLYNKQTRIQAAYEKKPKTAKKTKAVYTPVNKHYYLHIFSFVIILSLLLYIRRIKKRHK